MDKLNVYSVQQNLHISYPYYEPNFKDRSDLQRITVPSDDVAGCVYLVLQLLTPPAKLPADKQLDHHLSLLQIFQQQISRCQYHRELVSRFAGQYAAHALLALGNVHIAPGSAFSEQLVTDPLAVKARGVLLEILNQLALSPTFLNRVFNFTKVKHLNGSTQSDADFKHSLQALFKSQQTTTGELADEQLYAYLNTNTRCAYVDRFSLDGPCTVLDLVRICLNMLFDARPNSLQAAKLLNALAANSNFCFQVNLGPQLSSCLHQLCKQNIDHETANELLLALQQCVSTCGLAQMVNSGLFKAAVQLAQISSTMRAACQLLTDCALYDSGSLQLLFECNQQLPEHLIVLAAEELVIPEEPLRLAVLLLRSTQFAQQFAVNVATSLKVLKNGRISELFVSQVLTAAASCPAVQIRIAEVKGEFGVAGEAFQPETSDILKPKLYQRADFVW